MSKYIREDQLDKFKDNPEPRQKKTKLKKFKE